VRRLDDGTVLLTLDESAARVGKDIRTLQRWIAAGDLRPFLAVRDGRRRVKWFREADLLAADKRVGERTGGRPPKLPLAA
jgi:predicted site-specific integrase-resolvase